MEQFKKCFIENDLAILKHWVFATKTQKGNAIAARTIWFNIETMALQSAHEGYIKWIAVHPTKLEGYTL